MSVFKKTVVLCVAGRSRCHGAGAGEGLSAERRPESRDSQEARRVERADCRPGRQDRPGAPGRRADLPEGRRLHPPVPRRVLRPELRGRHDYGARYGHRPLHRARKRHLVVDAKDRQRRSWLCLAHRWKRAALRPDDSRLLRRQEADAPRRVAARHAGADERNSIHAAAGGAARDIADSG